MRRLALIAAAAALVLAACGGDDNDTTPTTTSDGFSQSPVPSGASPTAAPEDCDGARRLDAVAPATTELARTGEGGDMKQYTAAPPMTIDPEKRYFATIKMDTGNIKLELYPKDAPQHVNNFVFLSRDGYYDGATFHRVIPGFVAQAGDPTGTGRGGPGYTIPDEVNSCRFLDGTLGMAKTNAPNSAGSQWFIDYAPQPALDGGYTVFGQLIEGRDVLDLIAPRDPARATTPGTVINTITIEEST
jgi:cyclophilin family peptidyl-prolyl cis-trans isomerase